VPVANARGFRNAADVASAAALAKQRAKSLALPVFVQRTGGRDATAAVTPEDAL
jgi:hypothetical protein